MRDELSVMSPRLRRFARALISGSPSACDASDSLVHSTLIRALGNRAVSTAADLPIRLFATIIQLHRDLVPVQRSEFVASGARHPCSVAPAPAPIGRLAAALLLLPLEEREALLLVTLEGFDHTVAARILRISRPVLFDRLTRARSNLGQNLAAPPAASVPPASARAPYLRLVVG